MQMDRPKQLSHRPVSSGDPFLWDVYVSTRAEEMAMWGWPPAQQQAFLKMQFEARWRSYEAGYPGATYSILLAGDTPVGSVIVGRSAAEIRLIDIAFLAEHRSRGYGAEVITGLIEESALGGVPLRLSVTQGNRARRLYERLGFVVTQADEVYIEMEYRSGAPELK